MRLNYLLHTYHLAAYFKIFIMANYSIKAGDTLFEIAKSHSITLDALQAVNPGLNPTMLHVGQVIHLPSAGGSGSQPLPPAGGIPDANGGSNGGGDYVSYGGPASNFPHPST